MWLKSDIESNVKAGVVYGLKGDKVTVVADYVNVMIVENQNSERFPVKKEELSQSLIVPDRTIDNNIQNPVPAKKTKYKLVPKQLSLL